MIHTSNRLFPFRFDPSVRFSWGTAEKLLTNRAKKVDWECEDDDIEAKLSFTQKDQKRKLFTNHSYFTSRRMHKAGLPGRLT